ncbi:MAG: hypothetical protein C5B50_17965 [Verrucomicrobia bacterium]|nr:MAG: hypothetical protein C5B50_17965 [Verrucomicrobiota bacterium]
MTTHVLSCFRKSLVFPLSAFVLLTFNYSILAVPGISLICGTNKTVECGSAWSFNQPTVSDTCCPTNVTVTVLSTVTNGGPCSQTITRTWQATDCCSNFAMCSQTVTVHDTTPPVLTCASNKTVVCGSAWTFDSPAAVDACCGSNVTITVIGSTTNSTGCCASVSTRTWQAMDCCSNFAFCSQSVTSQPPTVTVSLPVGKTLIGDPFIQSNNAANVIFPNPDPTQDYTGPRDGDELYLYRCGSNGFVVVVFDSVTTDTTTGFTDVNANPVPAPILSPGCGVIYQNFQTHPETASFTGCPGQGPACLCGCNQWSFLAPQTANAVNSYQDVTGFPPVNGSAVSFNSPTGSVFHADTVFTNGVWVPSVPTLAAGHAAFFYVPCGFAVTCASNKTVQCGSAWTFDPPSDGCTNFMITPLSTITNGICPQFITRTWLVTDSCGNSNTCAQTVTVQDTTPPVITCASNKTVVCGNAWTFDPPIAFDACCGSNVTITVLSTITNGTFCSQTLTRTWQATDCCSNSATCSQTVTVQDTTPPVITCASNKTVVCGNPWTFDPPAAFDTCCGTNVTITILSTITNGVPCAQAITRTWQATDCCSNSAPCSQTVTVTGGATVDLALTMSLSPPSSVSVDDNLVITLTASNKGPATASGVVLSNWLPANIYFRSADSDEGVCSMTNGIVTCALTNMPPGASDVITIIVQPLVPGPLTNSAAITSGQTDANPADNFATVMTSAAQRYLVIVDPTNNGSVNPPGPLTLDAGTDQSFVATPDPGYTVDKWLLTSFAGPKPDTAVVATGTNSFTVTNIQSTEVLAVLFRPMGDPPSVVSNPVSQTVNLGTDVTFTVQAAGLPPLSYQWLFNGEPIDSATNTFLFLPGTSPSQSGDYEVLVTNIVSSEISDYATLTVRDLNTVLVSSGPNGSVSPQGTLQSYSGDSLALTAFPFLNFDVDQWFVDGVSAQSGGTQFSLDDIETNHTVSVTFRAVLPCLGLAVSFVDLSQGSAGLVGPDSLAGVRPQTGWLNANGNNGSLLLSNGISIAWQADQTGSLPIVPATADFSLMHDYLDSTNGHSTTIQIQGVPYASYSVLVYCDGNNGPPLSQVRVGRYTLNGSRTRFAKDDPTVTFHGIYGDGSSVIGGLGAHAGNYVVFTNVTGASVTITATGNYSSGGTLSAPVNAIQIVPDSPPNQASIQFSGISVAQSNVNLTINASPGTSVMVQKSYDITNWVTLVVLDNPNGQVLFSEPFTNLPSVFYRASIVVPDLQDGPVSFVGFSAADTNGYGGLTIYSNLQSLAFSLAASNAVMGSIDTGVIQASSWRYLAPTFGCAGQLDFSGSSGNLSVVGTVSFDSIADGIFEVISNGIVEAVFVSTKVKLDVDTDRDGKVDPVKDQKGKATWTKTRGAIFNVNHNRDSNNFTPDGKTRLPDAIWWEDNGDPHEVLDATSGKAVIENDKDAQDLAPLVIRHIPALQFGAKAFLSVAAADQQAIQAVHIYKKIAAGEEAIWGSLGDRVGGAKEPLEKEVTAYVDPAKDVEFGIEGLFYRNVAGTADAKNAFAGEFDITLEVKVGARSLGKDKVHIKVAPWMLLPNTSPSIEVWALDPGIDGDAKPMTDVLAKSGQLKRGAEPGGSQWFQDHVEIGYTERPRTEKRQIHSAFRLPYGKQPTWPRDRLLSGATGIFQLGKSLGGDSGDFGGNLELLPPGNNLGSIIHGDTMKAKLLNFLVDQQVQPAVELPSAWLAVGHVDEMITFSDNANEVIIADPVGAYNLLKAIAVGDRGKSVFFDLGGDLPVSAAASDDAKDTDRLETGVDYSGANWNYVRIYEDSGSKAAGQVGLIKTLGNGFIEVSKVWDTRPLTPRIVTTPAPSKATWYRNPKKGDKYVLVEDTQFWIGKAGVPPRPVGTPAFVTVAEVLADKDLDTVNNTQVKNVLDSIKTTLNNAAKPAVLTYKNVPVIYLGYIDNPPAFTFLTGRKSMAFNPGMANAQPVNAKMYMAQQFGPRNAAGEDIFQKAALAAVANSTFADDWLLYHRLEGEVHCGTATRRKPFTFNWWEHQP